MEILIYPSTRLRLPNSHINVFDEKLQVLADKMMDVMVANNGAGLAAPQIGENVRLFVTNQIPPYVFINPSWEPTVSSHEYTVIEGCLSFPGWVVPVGRWDAIKVEYYDLDGQKCTDNLKEFQAQVFQHETDHLEGTLLIDKLTRAQQETIHRNLVKRGNNATG